MGIIDKCMQHCDCTIHEISRGGVGTQLMRGDVMKIHVKLDSFYVMGKGVGYGRVLLW